MLIYLTFLISFFFMAAPTIQIQKKSNPAVKKKIQEKALSLFVKRGWELASGETVSRVAVTETKKKDVEPAGKDEHVTDSVATTDDEKTVDQLREEYETISGKEPDKRWKEPRLKEEIEKLTTQK